LEIGYRLAITMDRCGRRRFSPGVILREEKEGVANLTVGDAIREKRELIVRIAARHGASQVRLIGSVARGEARPDSDVDLLVTWNEGTSLLDQAALMLELESLLGRKVDIASDGWVKPSIRESVYRDAIAL
jgi:predicted nucleotidyltransferase